MTQPLPHADSYYAATARDRAAFAPLAGTRDVDVAIVGGGFTGVATALGLAERGAKVALCEANQIGWGASGRNGGQVTGSLSGDRAMLREFGRMLGRQAEDMVWALRWRGHDIIRERIDRYKIACDLRFGHLQTAMTPRQMAQLRAIYDEGCARGMGGDLQLLGRDEIPEYLETEIYCGGLLNRRNMHLHPLDLCRAEARAVQMLGGAVFEASPVRDIIHGPRPELRCDSGTIRAEKVLLAGNAYHLLEQRALRGKLFSASLANMATEPLSPADAAAINPQNLAVYDSRFVLDYYRLTADNRLLFGGGTNYSGRDSRDIAGELRPALERTFPRLRGIGIAYAWAGHDGIILNRIPQVGRMGAGGNIFYVQGYSGHGIALSHILSEITAEAMMGDAREFDLFAQVRHWHLPLSRRMGSYAIALGMAYYGLRDRLFG